MRSTSSPTSSEPSPPSRRVGPLVAWCIVAGIQIALAFGSALAASDSDTGDAFYRYEFAFGNTLVYGFIAGLTVLIASRTGDTRGALGVRRFSGRWVWAAIAVVVATALVSFLIDVVFHVNPGEEQGILPDDWRPDRAGAIAANAVVVAVVAPVVEELFFRGLGVRVLTVFGSVGAVVVSGLAFGLAHGLLVGLVPLALFGAGLAWVRLRAESIWPGVVAHGLYNGTVLAFGLACLSDAECRASLGCVL